MPDRLKNFNSGRSNFYLLGFIALILAGAVLKITAPVLLPFTIAVLLSFVLEPLVFALEKLRIPRIIGILLSILFIGAGLYLIGVILFSSGRTILTLYPKYERRFSEIYSRVAEVFSLPYDEHLTFFQNLWGQLGLRVRVQGLAFQLSEAFLGFLKD
ncbi:MAG TPA: AI-2E family transporter, partial [Spirochaetia bacterium]|nr:AI-2E family transporter [Spirochaetia bacterium]